MLYGGQDSLCRRGAAVKNLAHSASFHSCEKIAPSKPGTKHVERVEQRRLHGIQCRTWAWTVGVQHVADTDFAAAFAEAGGAARLP